MNRLLEIGFETCGHWRLTDGKLSAELRRHSSQHNVLYAFVCDGEVKYVGKTLQRLAKRLAGYRTPGPTQSTHLRVSPLIKAVLAGGGAVDILVLPDSGLMHYGQFHLNLAAGLEDAIIAKLSPQWNGSKMPRAEGDEPEEREALDTFPLVVHPTYLNSGFFNVPSDHQDSIGEGGDKIEIFCGDAKEPILGSINRTANRNQTPRIMGGAGLRDWFHGNLAVMQSVEVVVYSANSIRLLVPCAD